ncbi:glycosyltransferase [Stenotrophomonas sp. HITSZ_GD]|uniref:glycosyltransferase family 2 protein n=1 Tax=Stenotrophomonas sp. HITSZ_GD TaxID=3037248 RepID=UPI00240DF656|nr:glycosyltransferase [Stenotrophomonas sp. HITSZ_GD]MDG2526527.1 glycosyltransferase [Stenotrophomonas sp. HITSZ_GD]
MQPLLSVVVLVYNTAEYLAECFDSLLAQTLPDIEIIAIDDGSSDDSWAICRRYEAAHPNVRCITKTREGGAVSGNLGISLARGQYVALVDSDDVVPPDAYRLLVEAAQGAAADIAIGRAARLSEGVLSSTAFLHEPFVWAQRRVVHSVSEFPELIDDGFYWNKVFRTDFLRAHGLGMEPGLLYADRPFVHRAYFLSRCTAIIPELVYLWRTRPPGAEASITQRLREADNFADRMRSVALEWQQFEGIPGGEAYRRAIALTNLHRALHAAAGIVGSPRMREAFVAGVQQLLVLFGDLDYRSLGARRWLYLELIRRGEIEGLCFLLGIGADRGWLTEIDGACYWQTPFLDNAEIGIPREVMRLHFPLPGFFRLAGATLEGSRLTLELHLHDLIVRDCEVRFELHPIDGGAPIGLHPAGHPEPYRHLYGLDLADAGLRPGALYGVILHYRCAAGEGHYRIGPTLFPEGWARQPAQSGPHATLLYLPEAGGMALRADGTATAPRQATGAVPARGLQD